MAALFVSLPLLAQKPFHLELQASPGTVFPYLGRFGEVELHVYAGGIRAEALWLNGFSRNGSHDVTVVNPLGRMYMELPLAEIAPTLRKLAGSAAGPENEATPAIAPPVKGKVGGLDAVRRRLVYGPTAWIDVWMTDAVPENQQFRRIVNNMLEGISPGTAKAVKSFRGTPVQVELNFRRFRKVKLLTLKKLTMSADDEEDGLALGPLYVRATLLEKLFQ